MSSVVWKLDLYTKISRNEASCKACGRNLKLADGSTKTLFTHAKLHPDYNERLCALKKEATKSAVKVVKNGQGGFAIYFDPPPLVSSNKYTNYKVYLSADPTKPLEQWQTFDAEVRPEPSIQFNRGELEPDTPYYIRVAAENDDGEGVPSDVTQFTTVGGRGRRPLARQESIVQPGVAEPTRQEGASLVSQQLGDTKRSVTSRKRKGDLLNHITERLERLDTNQQHLDASQQRLEASLCFLEANMRKTSSILDRIILRHVRRQQVRRLRSFRRTMTV